MIVLQALCLESRFTNLIPVVSTNATGTSVRAANLYYFSMFAKSAPSISTDPPSVVSTRCLFESIKSTTELLNFLLTT